MRILLLTKRQYTRKDLLDDCYGRMFELPYGLAEAGHKVQGICLSYQSRNEGKIDTQNQHVNLSWYSINVGILIINGIRKFFSKAIPIISSFKPEIVIGGSDSIHIIMSYWLAKRLNIPFVVDLYDNFESFSVTKIPVIYSLFVRATVNADAVICVSKPLVDFVSENYRPIGQVFFLENAVNLDLFTNSEKVDARKKLNLPVDAKIIGTLGALNRSRNIDVLYQSFNKLQQRSKKVYLGLAGQLIGNFPESENVLYVGDLPYNDVPYFLNALDVAVICLQDSIFCRYCFPQKFYEILACKTPVLAANIGTVRQILSDYPELLFNHLDDQDLTEKIILQLEKKIVPNIKVRSWQEQSDRLESILLGILK